MSKSALDQQPENEKLIAAVTGHHERFCPNKNTSPSISVHHPEVLTRFLIREALKAVFQGTNVIVEIPDDEGFRSRGRTEAVAVVGHSYRNESQTADRVITDLPRHTARAHVSEISQKTFKKRGPSSQRSDLGQTIDYSSMDDDTLPGDIWKHHDRVDELIDKALHGEANIKEGPTNIPEEVFQDRHLDIDTGGDDFESEEEYNAKLESVKQRLLAHHQVLREEAEEYLASGSAGSLREAILRAIEVRQAILQDLPTPEF